MAVVINSAVSEAWRMNQFHIFCKLTAHQRLYVLWKQAYWVLYLQKMCRLSASIAASERLHYNWYTIAR